MKISKFEPAIDWWRFMPSKMFVMNSKTNTAINKKMDRPYPASFWRRNSFCWNQLWVFLIKLCGSRELLGGWKLHHLWCHWSVTWPNMKMSLLSKGPAWIITQLGQVSVFCQKRIQNNREKSDRETPCICWPRRFNWRPVIRKKWTDINTVTWPSKLTFKWRMGH